MKNNWPVKKLGEIAKYINGRAFKPEEWSIKGLPIIRIQNLTETQERYNYYKGFIEEKYLVNKGDILLSWSASLGVYFWNNEKAALNQHIFKVLPNPEIDKIFLFYLLNSIIKELKQRVHGSTMTHITKPTFEKMKVFVPAVSIQQKIVEKLDAIRKTQELNDLQISKTEELFNSLIDKEIGKLKINVIRLGDICKPQYGITQTASNKGSYRFIRITDIDEQGDLRNDNIMFVSENIKLIKSYILKRGDLLVARTGATYGKILYFDISQPAVFASYLIRLNPNISLISSKYLWMFSRSDLYWNQAKSLAVGAGQPQFNANKIKEIKIKLPDLKTQQKIVEKLEAVQEYKKKLIKQKDLLKELFDSVLDRCMKGEIN